MKRFLKSGKSGATSSEQTQGLAHGAAFKRLVIAGQRGADAAGAVANGFEAQCELAFDNLLAVIDSAQLRSGDLIKIVAYVAAPGSLAIYERVRHRKIGAVTPISTYIEVSGLGDPRWLVSIEGEAIEEISP